MPTTRRPARWGTPPITSAAITPAARRTAIGVTPASTVANDATAATGRATPSNPGRLAAG